MKVRKCIHSNYYPGCFTEKLQHCLFVEQFEKLDHAIRGNMDTVGREIILTCCFVIW